MLPENRRVQLDQIVIQMTQNNESDTNIRFVVEDFKQKYSTSTPTVIKKTPQRSVLGDVAVGAVKGVTNTLQTVASPITNQMNKILPGSATGFTKEQLTPTNTAQKIGKGVEQVAEFVVPGAAGLKVAKAPGLLNLASRAGVEGIGAGSVTAAQGGDRSDVTIGGAIGASFPVLGKVGQALSGENGAGRLVNSILKTRVSDLVYGKNPGKSVAEEGIIGSSLEDLVPKITQRRQEIGQMIGSLIETATKKGEKVSVFEAFSPIDLAIQQAGKAKRTNAALVGRLEDIKADLTQGKKLDKLSPREAFDLQQTVSDLTKFTGNQSDDKLVNKALQQVYRKLSDKVNESVKNKNIEILKDKYGGLLTAEKAGLRRMNLEQGQNIVGFSTKAIGGGAGLISLLQGDQPTEVILTSLLAGGGVKALSSPAVKTRVAAWLAKKTESERKEILKIAPYLKGLLINLIKD